MKKHIVFIFLFYGLLSYNNLLAEEVLPNKEQRVYALSLIWKELSYNFAFPEKLERANADSLYLAYIPRVEQVKNEYEYYRTLSSFIAHFDEAHTRIYPLKHFVDTPPVKAINFGNKIFVSDIANSMVDSIPIRSEIIKIDNVLVEQYLQDSIFPYISAATPQWKLDKAVTEMFYGMPKSCLNLTVRTPDGKEKSVQMVRNYETNEHKEKMALVEQFSPISIEIIENDIGYIQLKSFMVGGINNINQIFSENLPKLQNCKGLIIDIRGNRGGSDQAWEKIVSHLLQEAEFSIPVKCFSRINVGAYRGWGSSKDSHPKVREHYLGISMVEIPHEPIKNIVADSLKLNQPLVVISGYHVASAAEDFLLLIKGLKRATIVGEPSVGCVGEPMFINLPGSNMDLMLCAKKYVTLDGIQPNDTGILPDIFIKRDPTDFLEEKDNVLQGAILELQKLID